MNELTQTRLIEQLVSKRQLLIDVMFKQFQLTHQAHSICDEMDKLIPAHRAVTYDYLDIIFIQLRHVLGENSVRMQPRDVSMLTKSPEDLRSMFKKILDSNLWSILFNRLNIYSLMCKTSKEAFRAQLDANPLEFTVDNVNSTLSDLIDRQDEILIDSLMQSVLNGDQSYANNDKFRFKKKTVFTDTCSCRAGYVKVDAHSYLRDTLNILSRITFGKRTKVIEQKLESPYLWKLVEDHHSATDVDSFFSEPIHFSGGAIKFFKKGTAHLNLEAELVTLLNDKLSKSKSLFSRTKC